MRMRGFGLLPTPNRKELKEPHMSPLIEGDEKIKNPAASRLPGLIF
jgi:hypothetical protein